MSLIIYELTDDTEYEIAGIIKDGVFRGDLNTAHLAATYGLHNEQKLTQALDNHYVNARIADAQTIAELWDKDWEGEYSMDDLNVDE